MMEKVRSWLACVFVAIGLWAAPMSATAFQNELVTGPNYPPFTGPELRNGGLVTDIVQRTFEEMAKGKPISIAFAPWTRGYQLAMEGRYLGTFPYIRTPDREEAFHYSDPIVTGHERFFVLAGSSIVFESGMDLQGFRICSPMGYDQTRFLSLIDANLVAIDEPSDLIDCFRLLAAGRTDLVPIIEQVGLYTIAQDPDLNIADFRILERSLRVSTLHLIISRKIPEAQTALTLFNEKLRDLRDAGIIDQIIHQHLN
ncbi:ABC transporter substrate-binding protein [Roseibium aquae]|uniref:ABC transporter substrate-binding protein n=1 Tax=Roseibium aquae TaxID=1323746 RepID=A0A916TK96_9HYPH|nr:transporter substrate-binding domain-containing protein [Roseibium aquae]GGB50734.1 ABC transporter substrate-binding protein [Roseibium aquae]